MPQVRWSAVTEQVGWIVSNLMRCSNSCSAIHAKERVSRHTRPADWRLCPCVTRLLPVTLHIQSLQVLLGGWGRGYPWPARHLSRIRRSRLVGRPAPRSRAATVTEGSRRRARAFDRGSRSLHRTHRPASGSPVPPRRSASCHPPGRAPRHRETPTALDGLAGRSLTRTCPPRHAAAASGRVFVSRTAHNHRSTRVDSITSIMDCPPA